MGCDIHLVVERRNGSGEWQRVLPPPEVYDPWLVEQAAKPDADKWYTDRVKYVWFDDRNYNLFAILAGVRNSFDFVPISEPKGLPDDLSDAVRRLVYNDEEEDSNDVSLGDHSQSWLTVKELLDYNWTREVKEGGWVNPYNFKLWQEQGKPRQWCKSVGGGRVEHLSWRDMADYIDTGYIQFGGDGQTYTCTFDSIAGPRSYYAYVEWPTTCEQEGGRFREVVIPELQKLGEPENVRIVFGFDS